MDARFREPKLRPWEIGNWAATLGERYMEVQGYIYTLYLVIKKQYIMWIITWADQPLNCGLYHENIMGISLGI